MKTKYYQVSWSKERKTKQQIQAVTSETDEEFEAADYCATDIEVRDKSSHEVIDTFENLEDAAEFIASREDRDELEIIIR